VLQGNSPVWLLTTPNTLPEIRERYPVMDSIRHRDYEITRLKLKFLIPRTREKELTELVLLRLK
jgi:hypothetical protein